MNITKEMIPDPLKFHETFNVHDPSKLQSFMDCPRGYFFAYVCGFRQEENNNHLVFGSAWHEAMEHLMLHGYGDESVKNAYRAFLELYRTEYPDPSTDIARAPKNPEFALQGLVKYVNYWRRHDKFETLYTEVAASVLVSPTRLLYMKLDSILRDANNMIRSREHKTTKANSRPWRDKWSIILQPAAYTHLLHAAFPEEKIYGIEINGAIFTKSKIAEFERIPVQKTNEDMQRFLWEVNHWFDQLEWNFKMLSQCKESDTVMTAFPVNGQSCSKFGCRFPGLCSAYNNPIRLAEHPPVGYKIEFWDPRRDIEATAKHTTSYGEDGKVKIEKSPEEPKDKKATHINSED